MCPLFYNLKNDISYGQYNKIRGSQGFDGDFEAGEASRCDTLIAKLNLNAEDNLAYAA